MPEVTAKHAETCRHEPDGAEKLTLTTSWRKNCLISLITMNSSLMCLTGWKKERLLSNERYVGRLHSAQSGQRARPFAHCPGSGKKRH